MWQAFFSDTPSTSERRTTPFFTQWTGALEHVQRAFSWQQLPFAFDIQTHASQRKNYILRQFILVRCAKSVQLIKKINFSQRFEYFWCEKTAFCTFFSLNFSVNILWTWHAWIEVYVYNKREPKAQPYCWMSKFKYLLCLVCSLFR